MAKASTPDVSPIITETGAGAVRNAQIAAAKRAQAETGQIKYEPIERAGIGKLKKDGRRSGGCFSAKRLTIAEASNLREVSPDNYEVIDKDAVRYLLVPLHMEYKDYPTIREHEVVMAEHEAIYPTEAQRDRDLARQIDPFWQQGDVDEKGRPKKQSLGFGRFDPMWRNDEPGAGRAFGAGVMGQAEKIVTG